MVRLHLPLPASCWLACPCVLVSPLQVWDISVRVTAGLTIADPTRDPLTCPGVGAVGPLGRRSLQECSRRDSSRAGPAQGPDLLRDGISHGRPLVQPGLPRLRPTEGVRRVLV